MSLHHVLEHAAGPYLHLKYPHQSRWPAPAIWARFRGCGGHVSWAEAHQRGFLVGFNLTFLRDPIERVLSQYSFSQQAPGIRPDSVLARRLELKQLLLQTRGQFGSFWNAQTLLLSGLSRNETNQERHLESALENLEKFDFIGLTENFSDDVVELTQLLAGAPGIHNPSENRTAQRLHRDELNDETIALLKETQYLDRILYDRAKALQTSRKPTPVVREGIELSSWPPPIEIIGNAEARITKVTVRDANGGELSPGEEAELIIEWEALNQIDDITLGFAIEDSLGNYIAGTNTFLISQNTFVSPKGAFLASFRFPITMGPGRYLVNVALQRESQNICWINSAATFEVEVPLSPYREGMIDIIAQSHIGPSSSAPIGLSESGAHKLMLSIKANPRYILETGELQVKVGLVNESDSILSSSADFIFVSYHWLAIDSSVFLMDGLRSSLPRNVWPHETVTFASRVLLPPSSGRWRLQMRIVQEGVRWHEGPEFEGTIPEDLIFDYQENGKIILLLTILNSTELTPSMLHQNLARPSPG